MGGILWVKLNFGRCHLVAVRCVQPALKAFLPLWCALWLGSVYAAQNTFYAQQGDRQLHVPSSMFPCRTCLTGVPPTCSPPSSWAPVPPCLALPPNISQIGLGLRWSFSDQLECLNSSSQFSCYMLLVTTSALCRLFL